MKIQVLAAVLLCFVLCPKAKGLQLLKSQLTSPGALPEIARLSLTDMFNTYDTKKVEGAADSSNPSTADSSNPSNSSKTMEVKNMGKKVEEKIFYILDENYNTFIDPGEIMRIKRITASKWNELTNEETMCIVKSVDANEDGKIDFNEAYPFLAAL